ncbi:MAG: hypothetical protein PHI88_02925 [Candidatus Pacebacteria bacterium]|nr:hypothetical protein [Candidatus Paceibacterota bacterium]
MLDLFPSLFVTAVPAISSFILFFLVIKNSLSNKKAFFQHYLIGFAITSLVHFPIFIINLGIKINYDSLLVLYCFSSFFLLLSYLFFYRGSALYFTGGRFFNTVLPLVWVLYSAFGIFSLMFVGFDYFTIYTIIMWGFIFPANILLSMLFIYHFIKGSFLDDSKSIKERTYMLIFIFSWVSILVLDGVHWGILSGYPVGFWIIKMASFKGYFIVRAALYLLILLGCLIYFRIIKKSNALEKIKILRKMKNVFKKIKILRKMKKNQRQV